MKCVVESSHETIDRQNRWHRLAIKQIMLGREELYEGVLRELASKEKNWKTRTSREIKQVNGHGRQAGEREVSISIAVLEHGGKIQKFEIDQRRQNRQRRFQRHHIRQRRYRHQHRRYYVPNGTGIRHGERPVFSIPAEDHDMGPKFWKVERSQTFTRTK